MESLEEIEILQDKNTSLISDFIFQIIKGKMERNPKKVREYQDKLENLFRKTMGIVDILGRKKALENIQDNSEEKTEPDHFVEFVGRPTKHPLNISLDRIYDLPFDKALEAVLENRVFQEIPESKMIDIYKDLSKQYGEGKRALSFMGLTQIQLDGIDRVKSVIQDGLSNGVAPNKMTSEIEDAIRGFSKARAETVFRTQTSKAYTSGQWKQIQDPFFRNQIGALRFNATKDSNVRPDHLALDGWIGKTDDPYWEWITPPIHYNCRCSIDILSKNDLNRIGQLDPSGQLKRQKPIKIPTPNFGRRKAKSSYGYF